MARAKQPVSINGIEFDALIEESRTLKASVPEYAVDDGFTVSDTIILQAEELSMTLFLTDMPVTWYAKHGSGNGRVESVCNQLEELYYKATPVTVSTTDAVYTDMAIETIEFRKSVDSGYAREIPISFRKVRKTTTSTTTIPSTYGKAGITGENSGNASTSSATNAGSLAVDTSFADDMDAIIAAAQSGAYDMGGDVPISSGGGTSSGSSGGESKSSILYGIANKIGIL